MFKLLLLEPKFFLQILILVCDQFLSNLSINRWLTSIFFLAAHDLLEKLLTVGLNWKKLWNKKGLLNRPMSLEIFLSSEGKGSWRLLWKGATKTLLKISLNCSILCFQVSTLCDLLYLTKGRRLERWWSYLPSTILHFYFSLTTHARVWPKVPVTYFLTRC